MILIVRTAAVWGYNRAVVAILVLNCVGLVVSSGCHFCRKRCPYSSDGCAGPYIRDGPELFDQDDLCVILVNSAGESWIVSSDLAPRSIRRTARDHRLRAQRHRLRLLGILCWHYRL